MNELSAAPGLPDGKRIPEFSPTRARKTHVRNPFPIRPLLLLPSIPESDLGYSPRHARQDEKMETPDRHPKGTIARVDFSEIERLGVYVVSASLVIHFTLPPSFD